jgi:D-aminoacyl-tRNA deacylase
VIALLQRVRHACVTVAGETVGRIDAGVLAFVAVERTDSEREADRLLERVIGYRLFADGGGRMNMSLQDISGALLLVPQFTLAADTRKGMRASFDAAADPGTGHRLFEYLVERARERHSRVQTGRFGADMQVSLTNDGPVTFLLRVPAAGDERAAEKINHGQGTRRGPSAP